MVYISYTHTIYVTHTLMDMGPPLKHVVHPSIHTFKKTDCTSPSTHHQSRATQLGILSPSLIHAEILATLNLHK